LKNSDLNTIKYFNNIVNQLNYIKYKNSFSKEETSIENQNIKYNYLQQLEVGNGYVFNLNNSGNIIKIKIPY